MLNKKMLLSLLVIGVVSITAGAGTWAYYSDTETSTGNSFTAGTLDLEVGDEYSIIPIVLTNLKPSDADSYDYALKNTGDIPGSLDITFSTLVDLENGVNEAEAEDDGIGLAEDGTVATPGTDGELAESLHLLIYIDEVEDDTYVATDDTLVYDGMASGIIGEQLTDYPMTASYAKSIRIEYDIDGNTVGNEIQSDSTGFDIEFELLQNADV